MPLPPIRWSLAAPLLVLAGIFAMHGLAAHGLAGHPPAQPSLMPAVVASAQVSPHSPESSADAVSVATANSGANLAGLAGTLCLAVLLGGLAAWLALRRSARPASWLVPRQRHAPLPAPRSRAPDPPTNLLLSVIRC